MGDLVSVLKLVESILSILCFLCGLLLVFGPNVLRKLSTVLDKPLFSIEKLGTFLDKEISTAKLEEILEKKVTTDALRERLDQSVIIDKRLFDLRIVIGVIALVAAAVLFWSLITL